MKEIIIKCQRNELMRDIICRYEKKSGLKINEFDFLYNETKINMDLTLDQINDKDKQILIIVNPRNIEGNKDEIKKSNSLKPFQCIDQSAKNSKIVYFWEKNEKKLKILNLFLI